MCSVEAEAIIGGRSGVAACLRSCSMAERRSLVCLESIVLSKGIKLSLLPKRDRAGVGGTTGSFERS